MLTGTLVPLAIFVATTLLLRKWARWLAARPGASRAWRFAPAAIVAVACLGMVYVVDRIVVSFGAIEGESVDPSQKARVLAEGISTAMNCFTGAVLALALSAVALGVGTAWVQRKRP